MKNHSIQIERQSGFTLQSTSIKLSYDAYLRSQASLLSYDLMDRVRSNSTANYSFDTITGTTAPSGSPTACFTSSCSPTEMARADLAAWFEEASTVFADGRFSLKINSSTASILTPTIDEYELRINWQDRYEVEDAEGSADQADNPSIDNNRAEFVFFFDVRNSS